MLFSEPLIGSIKISELLSGRRHYGTLRLDFQVENMRFELSVVAAMCAAFNGRFDVTLVLLLTGFSSNSFRRLSSFISSVYLRYSYSRLNDSIKAALASKKELTQAHIDPIALRKWKEVLAWITFHPDELLLVDKTKQTVLHHCCLFRAPAVVIEMILYQAPELVAMKNQDGEIPLNWAVRLSAPIEVFQLLLSVDPGLGCTSKDKAGNTALSLIWERHSDILLDMWWQHGRDKLTEFHWWKRILFLLECYHRANLPSNDESNRAKIWHAQYCNTSYPFLPLHTAARCPGCPVSLFPLIVKVYFDQLKQEDGEGRLPLAVACLDAANNRSSGVSTKIQLLLQAFPGAAEIRDRQLRLPVHTALESGIVFDEGISELLSASPKCLQQYDPVTGLAPFLLAAVGSSKRLQQHPAGCTLPSYSNEGCSDEIRSLSTIYTLLRTEPSQLLRQRCFYCADAR